MVKYEPQLEWKSHKEQHIKVIFCGEYIFV
jgi:hypothetical protein